MMMWDGSTIPMHEIEIIQDLKEVLTTYQDSLEPSSTNKATKWTLIILDAKYKKANLQEVIENNCAHLKLYKQAVLLEVLLCYEVLFYGSLGYWDTTPVSFELKDRANLYHGKAFLVTYINE